MSAVPKRVLIFSLAYFPKHVGGAEVAIKEITDRISPQDIEFHMITLRFDSTLPKVEKIGNKQNSGINGEYAKHVRSFMKKWTSRKRRSLWRTETNKLKKINLK